MSNTLIPLSVNIFLHTIKLAVYMLTNLCRNLQNIKFRL